MTTFTGSVGITASGAIVRLDYGVTNPDETTIERGPMLTVQPTDTVYETEDSVGYAFIDCRASAYPAAGYTWVREKDGVQVELDPGKEARYTVTNGRLVITKPNSAADDGLYQCKAHNHIGLVLSNTAKLTAGCKRLSYIIVIQMS